MLVRCCLQQLVDEPALLLRVREATARYAEVTRRPHGHGARLDTMLLRRELAVSGCRAPIYSTIINLSPFRDSESDHALHRLTESKRRKHTWNTTRGSRDLTAYGTWHHPSPPPNPAPSVLLPKHLHRRPSAFGGTSKSGIATSSIRGLQSVVAGRARFAEHTSQVHSSRKPSTTRFISHAPSRTLPRKRRLIMATNDFRDHSNQLDADCKTLKRLLNDAEELYDCGSSTRILFCDLRDELVFSLYTLSCLLEQITTFYNLWKSKTGPSRNRRESNALVAGTSRRKKLGIVYLTTVWREVRDSRHLIMSYARLIDSYHQRRNMPGRIDGILTRVDSLYSSIDAAGHAFVYPHQISPNAQLLELLQSVAATKRKLLAISRFFRDFVHLKKLLAPYAHNFLKDAETVNVSLDMLEEHLIRPSVVVYRRTTTNKTDDPALQNGSSVSLQAQGSKGNNSSQVKRLLPTVGPKRPHSQAGAATNVLSHTPGISRPQSTACLAPTAPDLGRNALSHQSCRQSSQPLMKGHISELWLDFYRLRQLSLAVTRSIEALADMLRLPTSKDIDNVYMNHFLLCAVESHHWKCFEFSKTSHDARLCTGFREERERATHKLGACTGSSVLERLHDESRTDATRAFCHCRRLVYSSRLRLQQCRILCGLYTKFRLRKICWDIVNPCLQPGRRMQEELRNGDEAPYLLKKLETSHNRIKRITRELIDCRTDRFISVSILSRKTITTTLKGFQLSFNTLYPELSQLQKEILADKRIISFGLLPSLMVCRQSPVYPRLRGKAIHDFRVGLLKLGFQNVTSASKPRVAAFHTSAATRRPPVTDDAALRNEQPLEEETDQVSRSNDASDAQAGSLIGYCIPEVRMRECLQAPRTARSAYWQYTLYEGPKAEKVKVHYCKSLETSERIAKRFLNERVIGFDIEWKPQASAKEGIRKNVAVIQLASEDRIAIFHLARFSKGDSIDELVAPSLRRIMESASITKVGVSIKSDCTRVRKFLGINSRGLFELSHLYKLVKYATNDVKKINKMLVSLATQTEQHLLLPMYKDESVRSSDWSEDLNYEQIYCTHPPYHPLNVLFFLAKTSKNRRRIRLLRRLPTLPLPQPKTSRTHPSPTPPRPRRPQPPHPSRQRPNSRRIRRPFRRGTVIRAFLFSFHRALIPHRRTRRRRHEPPDRRHDAPFPLPFGTRTDNRPIPILPPVLHRRQRLGHPLPCLPPPPLPQDLLHGSLLPAPSLLSPHPSYPFFHLHSTPAAAAKNPRNTLAPACLLPLPPPPPLRPGHRGPAPRPAAAARHGRGLRPRGRAGGRVAAGGGAGAGVFEGVEFGGKGEV